MRHLAEVVLITLGRSKFFAMGLVCIVGWLFAIDYCKAETDLR